MPKILAVDDDADILALIKNALSLKGYQVDTHENAQAVDKTKLTSYDIILLDVLMPEMDGVTYCQEIRDLVDCPILFLTAKNQEADIVTGLASGADDYIAKPFGVQELLARLQAHLRREKRERHISLIRGAVHFDLGSKTVSVQGQTLSLTKSEYEICEYLAKYPGQVFSKEQLYDHLVGFEERGTPAAIAEHVRNIRAKFRNVNEEPIETVWGIGYRWQSEQ